VFINFEGIDGSGKSTQCELLHTRLKLAGFESVLTVSPGSNLLDITQEIRKLALNPKNAKLTTLFLMLADISEHTSKIIIRCLKENKVIVMDRYTDSTLIYQSYAHKINNVDIHALIRAATYGIIPDITVYVDTTPEVAFERLNKRKTEIGFEDDGKLDFLKTLKNGYDLLYKHRDRTIMKMSGETCSGGCVLKVDGDLDAQTISDTIFTIIEERLQYE